MSPTGSTPVLHRFNSVLKYNVVLFFYFIDPKLGSNHVSPHLTNPLVEQQVFLYSITLVTDYFLQTQ